MNDSFDASLVLASNLSLAAIQDLVKSRFPALHSYGIF